MDKNVASQKIQLFAFDTTTGTPKTGDAANITAYVSKDHGAVTVLGDTSATEMDATNAKGVYVFDLTQGETNATELTFSAKSSTANISITPRFVTTNPPNFALTTIDSSGIVDADVRQWLGTAASTPTVAGVPNVNVKTWNDLTTVELPLVPTTAGRKLDVSAGGEAGVDWANVGSPTTTLALTGTTIAVTQKVDVDTIKTNPVVNGGTITFPTTATLASTTNITAGTIATVTNLTNAPTNGDLTSTMKTSVQTASDAAVTANSLINAIAGYIDTEVAAIKAKTDNLPASPAATGAQMALTSAAIDLILDDPVEGSTTLRQLIRGMAAAMLGKASGLAGTTAVYRDVGDSKDRITATVDANGNRTAVTLDLT